MATHETTAEGESTANWAISRPGFLGSIDALLKCGRCGEDMPTKRHDEKRKVRDVLKPSMHFLCDECHNALPD